jgi:SAM-dependent methyltransferase
MRIVEAPEKRTYLNVGCGDTYFEEWTNADLNPGKNVQRIDLRRPLPFPDDCFDAIYSSHVLEHLLRKDAETLLRDILRKLKPGGTVRIVVPDLEGICRLYLQYLDEAETAPGPDASQRYRWMQLELLDQLVREQPGGEMRTTLDSGEFDMELARNRVGDALDADFPAGLPIITQSNRSDILGTAGAFSESLPQKWRRKIKRFVNRITGNSRDPRATGEIHRWMYDRRSLRELLVATGFENCECKQFDESRIPHWEKYNLDVSRFGSYPRKPDSLYLEGTRPINPANPAT